LTGAGANESVAVGALGANSYTFTNVQLAATGFSAILTATFSDNTACTLTDNAGLSPAPCSPNATGIPTMSEWGTDFICIDHVYPYGRIWYSTPAFNGDG
jgi:hypothetical protein